MIRNEQEFLVIDNRGDDQLRVSSTHPAWMRVLERLERRNLARRTRTITAVENGQRKVLGAEWVVDREVVALRLAVRRKATEAQRRAAARATATRLGRETNAGASVASSRASQGDAEDVSDERGQGTDAPASRDRSAESCAR